ncbi:sugar ABC transporter permease [Paenibacillus sp. JCM 10914]|uniref:ABC transporter permease n=1 Tax=Paenibacillus sp. JCM 10914 TaxID=1236974 RepID=UPI0003CC8533|nr:ABC transporter permease subunit [Paenibacillus sp. JCM 10914]GAE08330.1 predicted beta-xyloside ABC transporter, permease component [Paenibacillus sp. JCM 10914]
MADQAKAITEPQSRADKRRHILGYMWKFKALYFISLPGLLFFALFKYVPLMGSVIAFQNYNLFAGVTKSPWAGLEHFQRMFQHYDFLKILRNTLLLGIYDIIFAFTAPIVLALLLNEVRQVLYKKIVQTIFYAPHFLSWVIVSGIFVGILSPSSGIVNVMLGWFGIDPIYFLGEDSYIRSVLVGSGLWRDVGWGTIIYLAALAGINPDLYEASNIDGAGRWRQTLSITLPALMPVITILFLLKIGDFLDYGFERVFVFQNPLNIQNSEILDTYIYKAGLQQLQYSYATAIGVFKSVVGLFLITIANTISKKATGESLY